jgi:hypothetical protein
MLGKVLFEVLQEYGMVREAAQRAVLEVKLMISSAGWFDNEKTVVALLQDFFLQDTEAQDYLGINSHEGVRWFKQESFDRMLVWHVWLAAVETPGTPKADRSHQFFAASTLVRRLEGARVASGCRVEELLSSLSRCFSADPERGIRRFY